VDFGRARSHRDRTDFYWDGGRFAPYIGIYLYFVRLAYIKRLPKAASQIVTSYDAAQRRQAECAIQCAEGAPIVPYPELVVLAASQTVRCARIRPGFEYVVYISQ